MKTIEVIILLLWFLPSSICGYFVLSSPLCGLSEFAAAFISFWIYCESIASQINKEKLQNQINDLRDELKTK